MIMSCSRLLLLPTVRDIVKLYRLSAAKQLSQNFLLNEKITDRIVKFAGNINKSDVLEIGPGPGALTRSIIKKCPKKLVLVEKDERFKPMLEMLRDSSYTTQSDMKIIIDDIMNINMTELFTDVHRKAWHDEAPNIHLIGNLPFNISTALIIKWLQNISEKKSAWSFGRVQMTLTFQKEVAERLVAKVSDKNRCRLSTIAQTWTSPKLQFIIPGREFVPIPNVDVGVVSFIPLRKPKTHHTFKVFEKVNRHLFSFRQKHGIKCARTMFPPDLQDELSTLMYTLADVDIKTQAYNLSIENISRLTSAYIYLCQKYPEIENYNYRVSRQVLSKNLTKSLKIESY
ncbi:dimethyladenosine transferase 1, mitochondrial [Copidosoma floridanum]|uniref:dimethyladenosine transferase 1, mitochondrial n=1 Tax=Copidosoma floridanum TaxID=29053 RepID=UPI0006C95FFF|nr:dimethyladenosine transferase 1, mitochondrial [Copidosoma floridanum]